LPLKALRLTDHYNFRSITEKTEEDKNKGIKTEPAKLDDTGKWVEKFYDKDDIRYVERKLFA